jgi:O-antigen/teichoic acid export membrane protein
MISYSKPMVANSISWWVNNASDRYVVTWLRGIGTNGIYSVSYKIPSIMVVLQGIFSQAWTLSATKEFDKDDKDSFFINIYNTYNFILVFICSFLIFMDKPLAKLLFAKEFYSAWKYAPFLMISTIFSGLAAFLGGVLSALKKSSLFAKSSVITAFVNTILNIILVIFIGPIGAAISTAFAYLLMWIIRLQLVKQCINLKVNLIRDSLAYLILNIQAVLLLVTLKNNVFCWYQIIFILVILLLYIREGKAIVSRALKRFCNR